MEQREGRRRRWRRRCALWLALALLLGMMPVGQAQAETQGSSEQQEGTASVSGNTPSVSGNTPSVSGNIPTTLPTPEEPTTPPSSQRPRVTFTDKTYNTRTGAFTVKVNVENAEGYTLKYYVVDWNLVGPRPNLDEMYERGKALEGNEIAVTTNDNGADLYVLGEKSGQKTTVGRCSLRQPDIVYNFVPLKYNAETKQVTMEVSASAKPAGSNEQRDYTIIDGGYNLKYFVHQYYRDGNMTSDEMFQEAQPLAAEEMELTACNGSLYVWPVNEQGQRINRFAGGRSSYSLYATVILSGAAIRNQPVEIIGGVDMAQLGLKVSLEKSALTWDKQIYNSDPGLSIYACVGLKYEKDGAAYYSQYDVGSRYLSVSDSVYIGDAIVSAVKSGSQYNPEDTVYCIAWGLAKWVDEEWVGLSEFETIEFEPKVADTMLPELDPTRISWKAGQDGVAQVNLTGYEQLAELAQVRIWLKVDDQMRYAFYRDMNPSSSPVLELNYGNSVGDPGKRYQLFVDLYGKDVAAFAPRLNIPGPVYKPTDGAKKVDEALKEKLRQGAGVSREFALNLAGEIPYTVGLHMALGTENAGRTAYLYRYDAASQTVALEGRFGITESGQAMFTLRRGGAYLAVVSGDAAPYGGTYSVVRGDTLSGIAAKHGVSLKELLAANPQVKDANKIWPGQALQMPVK